MADATPQAVQKQRFAGVVAGVRMGKRRSARLWQVKNAETDAESSENKRADERARAFARHDAILENEGSTGAHSRFCVALACDSFARIARDHLANERTFLAWLRVSLTCIALSVPLHELLRISDSPLLHFASSGSLLLSTGLLGFSTMRYYENARLLQIGLFRYNRRGIGTITFVALLFSVSLFGLLASAGRESLIASGGFKWKPSAASTSAPPSAEKKK